MKQAFGYVVLIIEISTRSPWEELCCIDKCCVRLDITCTPLSYAEYVWQAAYNGNNPKTCTLLPVINLGLIIFIFLVLV